MAHFNRTKSTGEAETAKPIVWLVFDKLPNKSGGGLAFYYDQIASLLADEIDFKLISVFRHDGTDLPGLSGKPVETIIDKNIDMHFVDFACNFKKGGLRAIACSVWSAVLYFCSIPIARYRARRIINGEGAVATAPSAAIFLPKRLRFILEVHSQFEFFWGNSISGRLQTLLMSSPECIVFRTKTDAEKGRAIANSSFIYNCVADPLENKTPKTLEERKKHSVLFMGRLSREKNPLFICDIVPKILEHCKDLSVDVFGDGPLKDDLALAISESSLSDSISLRVFTNEKHIFNDYDQLWITSDIEGFPLSAIEAMACGTPIISTHWGDGAEEVLGIGYNAICDTKNDFTNAAITLLENEEMWNLASRANRENYEKRFSLERLKEDWRNILSKTLDIAI